MKLKMFTGLIVTYIIKFFFYYSVFVIRTLRINIMKLLWLSGQKTARDDIALFLAFRIFGIVNLINQ